MLIGLCCSETTDIFNEDKLLFIHELEMLAMKTGIKTINSTDVANSQILARLISFKPEFEKK